MYGHHCISVYWWVKVREIIIKKTPYIVEIGEGERRVPREDLITGGIYIFINHVF